MMNKWKRYSWKIWLTAAAAVLAGCIVSGAWLLLSPMPSFAVPVLMPRDFAVQNRLVGQLMSELWDGKKTDSFIVFSPEEVESLLRVVSNGVLISGAMRTDDGGLTNPYCVNYRDGGFDFVAPVFNTRCRWLFGGVLVLRGHAVPAKNGDAVDIELSQLSLGRLPLPGGVGETVAAMVIAKQRNKREFSSFNSAVRKIEIGSGNRLRIDYRPMALRKILLKF